MVFLSKDIGCLTGCKIVQACDKCNFCSVNKAISSPAAVFKKAVLKECCRLHFFQRNRFFCHMKSSIASATEEARRHELSSLSTLDTLPEKEFDDIVESAARIRATPYRLHRQPNLSSGTELFILNVGDRTCAGRTCRNTCAPLSGCNNGVIKYLSITQPRPAEKAALPYAGNVSMWHESQTN